MSGIDRLLCRCESDDADSCPWHGDSVIFGGVIQIEVDEALPPDVIEVRGATTTRIRLRPDVA